MYMDCRGQFAQSRQRRIQRWLNNPRINVHRIYKSLIKLTLANWSESSIFLALDTSLFWDEYCLVRLESDSSWQSFTSSVEGDETQECQYFLCRLPGDA